MKTLEQIEPRKPISALPYTISEPGAYYVTTNLTGTANSNGITIMAQCVTLDLGGFELAGVANSGDGIRVSGIRTNIVIRNGCVRKWGGAGVEAANARNSMLLELRASHNGLDGLHLGQNGIVRTCGAAGNGDKGIEVGDGSRLSNCTAQNNDLGITTAAACVVSDCTAFDNVLTGITVGNGSTVVNCAAFSNTNGISTGGSCTVTACTASSNGTNGIITDFGNTISGCTVNLNRTGINVSSNCRIVDNACSLNSSAGILVRGDANRIDGNTVTDNGIGLRSNPASGNLIVRNSASGNTTDYNIAAANTVGPILGPANPILSNNPWANFSF